MQGIIFREVQYAPGWALLLLAAIGVLMPLAMIVLARRQNRAVAAILYMVAGVAFLICAAIALLFGKMTTEVAGTDVRVRFGWLPGYAETIPVAEVQNTQVVRYDPTGEYGGWGIRRRSSNNRALNQRGDRGVRLRFEGDRWLLIGSQRPEDLAAAITQVQRR